jgi:hypothetical protein
MPTLSPVLSYLIKKITKKKLVLFQYVRTFTTPGGGSVGEVLPEVNNYKNIIFYISKNIKVDIFNGAKREAWGAGITKSVVPYRADLPWYEDIKGAINMALLDMPEISYDMLRHVVTNHVCGSDYNRHKHLPYLICLI